MVHSCQKLSCAEKMYSSGAQGVVLRVSIVLGMVAAVVTILYLTPVPDQYFKSCDRPCHDLDWPMICRVKLVLEPYQTMGGSCEDCPNNLTHCSNPHCASADGAIRGIIAANRQLPGPAIQVCQNDILVVDVINKIPGHSLAVHWRGQPQNEAPYMDGVPLVTQCPIPSYTTFQYKFRASAPGTHYWHAHSGSNRANGFFGGLVVRQADRYEPHRKLYDFDEKEHLILISEWGGDSMYSVLDELQKPKSLLINGRAPSKLGNTLAVFKVRKGKRYRFRLAYTGGMLGCPVTVSIDQHLLKVIALDGNPTNPYEVNSIALSKGERVDFVLKTSQEQGAYFIRVRSDCSDDVIESIAVLNYEESDNSKVRIVSTNIETPELKTRKFSTATCDSNIGQVCLGDVSSLKKMPETLRAPEMERKIYLPFDYKTTDGTGAEYYASDARNKIHRMNNITFTFPPSPLLSQLTDVNYKTLCNSLTLPDNCNNREICECVHIEYIPLGTTVELVFIDQGGESAEHIFHMHGYSFYLVGSKKFEKSMSLEHIKKLDKEERLFKRNLMSPVQKDTIRIPRFGVTAVRFHADNPGFWMLRDEHSHHWTRGLDVVFQVGHLSDMIPLPTNFPTCGSWIGPDFFLV